MFLRHIQTVTAGSAVASISFSDIPQDGTDLVVFVSARSNTTTGANLQLTLNSSTANFSYRLLEGDGATVGSYNNTTNRIGYLPPSSWSGFSNGQVYITNYTSSVAKSISSDVVTENNATTAYQDMTATLWNVTSPITALSVTSTENLQSGSSASLYKVIAGTDRTTTVS